ncbi:MAG: class I SAM-dependent methyltransferase [Eubacteriales bacterium]
MFNEKPIISKWVADMYDQNVTESNDVVFLLSLIGSTPKRILEVCCGSGRILVPLARIGHNVYGFDADEFMLEKIQAKAQGLGNIEWSAADAINSDWGENYDVVVLAGNILYNIVSDMDYAKSQELFIQKTAAALTPGGYIYIEYQPGGHKVIQTDEESHMYSSERVIWKGKDSDGNYGKMILLVGEYDMNTRLDRFTRRFELTLKSGELIRQDIPCVKHFASLDQVHGWLSNAGFTVEYEYEGFDRKPVTDDSHGVIIYARKGVR